MAGLQPDIYAAISITWIAAFVALILRLKARGMMKTKLWYDDYFAIVALVCFLGDQLRTCSQFDCSSSSRAIVPLLFTVCTTLPRIPTFTSIAYVS